MNREEAVRMQSTGKPCFYVGRLRYFQTKPLYIKHVKTKGVAVVSFNLIDANFEDYHEIRLENLVASFPVLRKEPALEVSGGRC